MHNVRAAQPAMLQSITSACRGSLLLGCKRPAAHRAVAVHTCAHRRPVQARRQRDAVRLQCKAAREVEAVPDAEFPALATAEELEEEQKCGWHWPAMHLSPTAATCRFLIDHAVQDCGAVAAKALSTTPQPPPSPHPVSSMVCSRQAACAPPASYTTQPQCHTDTKCTAVQPSDMLGMVCCCQGWLGW